MFPWLRCAMEDELAAPIVRISAAFREEYVKGQTPYLYCAGAVPAGFGTSVLMSLKFSTVLNSRLNSPKFCHR